MGQVRAEHHQGMYHVLVSKMPGKELHPKVICWKKVEGLDLQERYLELVEDCDLQELYLELELCWK